MFIKDYEIEEHILTVTLEFVSLKLLLSSRANEKEFQICEETFSDEEIKKVLDELIGEEIPKSYIIYDEAKKLLFNKLQERKRRDK